MILRLALCALVLAAPAPVAAQEKDRCGLAEAQAMVGTHAPGLTSVSIGHRVRIVRPKSHAPHDKDERRLNIELDANEVVIRVWCG